MLPLLPIGFGIGLTLPVFLLAVREEVAPRDVGEASGLVQFLPSLGGSISLSVLASFAVARFAVLDPPPASGCAAPTSFRAPACVYFLAGFPSAQMTAYDAAFTVISASSRSPSSRRSSTAGGSRRRGVPRSVTSCPRRRRPAAGPGVSTGSRPVGILPRRAGVK